MELIVWVHLYRLEDALRRVQERQPVEPRRSSGPDVESRIVEELGNLDWLWVDQLGYLEVVFNLLEDSLEAVDVWHILPADVPRLGIGDLSWLRSGVSLPDKAERSPKRIGKAVVVHIQLDLLLEKPVDAVDRFAIRRLSNLDETPAT